MKIEIVRSHTPRLSSMGLKSCIMLQTALRKHYPRVDITYVDTETDLENLIARRPDVVFLGFKNMPAADEALGNIWICEQLDANDIAYTGSAKAAMLLDNDKYRAKHVISEAGLRTAESFTARPGQYATSSDLPLAFPVFIKPPQAGGGSGIDDDSVARNFEIFERKVAAVAEDFGTAALVESYLTGREFSVAVLETDGAPLIMPIELITEPNQFGDQILSGKVKSADTEHVIAVPAGPLRDELVTFAADAFLALGARDYGRIDIRMDENNRLHFLEANLIPGIAEHDFTSYFVSACRINQAMGYETMILHIIELAQARNTTISLPVDLPSQTAFVPVAS